MAQRSCVRLRRRGSFSALRLFSLLLLLVAIIQAAAQLVVFSRLRSYLPAGLIVAGVPVGQMDRQQAAQSLEEVYSTPVELRYNDAVIHFRPLWWIFAVDVENMLAMANLERTQQQFWVEFWDFLWGRRNFRRRFH